MSNRAEEEKTGKLMKKGEVAGRSGEQEKRHKETNGKKATTAETKPDNISRQDKSDCGKDAQEEGRQAGRTLGPAGRVRACGQLKVCA